ncbi:MAG: hypothetical protein HYW95_02525 [Candidatus Wildermuthbacteria bacterium]|nr:hypothetical protein [Candidatus Wildermuthbacteria bacterium]
MELLLANAFLGFLVAVAVVVVAAPVVYFVVMRIMEHDRDRSPIDEINQATDDATRRIEEAAKHAADSIAVVAKQPPQPTPQPQGGGPVPTTPPQQPTAAPAGPVQPSSPTDVAVQLIRTERLWRVAERGEELRRRSLERQQETFLLQDEIDGLREEAELRDLRVQARGLRQQFYGGGAVEEVRPSTPWGGQLPRKKEARRPLTEEEMTEEQKRSAPYQRGLRDALAGAEKDLSGLAQKGDRWLYHRGYEAAGGKAATGNGGNGGGTTTGAPPTPPGGAQART